MEGIKADLLTMASVLILPAAIEFLVLLALAGSPVFNVFGLVKSSVLRFFKLLVFGVV